MRVLSLRERAVSNIPFQHVLANLDVIIYRLVIIQESRDREELLTWLGERGKS
jgi:hypothetical protein